MSAFRFAESRRDGPTGLDYMNARYYDSALPRFISADPIISDVYAPQTLNRYAYALNDPITLNDPSGLCVEYKDENRQGLDCTTPQEIERDWQREQRTQQKEEFRQMQELGPPRPQASHPPGDISIFIVRDWSMSIGTHAALLLEGEGREPLLYDPAGSYKDIVPTEFVSTGALVVGEKYARASRFIKFHIKKGSEVEKYEFDLSARTQT